MQKKLLAAAVLSAFSGVAAAQSANVTIYGTLYSQLEWGTTSGGDSTTAAQVTAAGGRAAPNHTYAPATGAADPGSRIRTDGAGANFGLRGTEDLGNGLQAWFQLEVGTAGAMGGINSSSATTLTGYQGLTYRNSAIGLRGQNWGSFLVGIWDTPYTVAFGQAALVPKLLSLNSGNPSSGFYGTTPMAAGTTFSGTSIVQACNYAAAIPGVAVAASGGNCLTATQMMDRRQAGTLQYWTPNWNGFEGRLMFTPTGESYTSLNANQAAVAGATNKLNPYMWGLSLNYGNGGFFGSYAYQRHVDLLAAGIRQSGGTAIALTAAGTQSTAFTGNMTNSTDQAHRIGLKYKFDSGFGIGGRFEYMKGNYGYGASPIAGAANQLTGFTKKTYGVSGSYETGPHAVLVEFAKIPDATFRGDNGGNTGAAGNDFSGNNSGARQWMIAYDYALSKRTDLQAYYVQITNDANSKYTGTVFNAITPVSGGDPRYFGVGLRHTF